MGKYSLAPLNILSSVYTLTSITDILTAMFYTICFKGETSFVSSCVASSMMKSILKERICYLRNKFFSFRVDPYGEGGINEHGRVTAPKAYLFSLSFRT